MKGTYLIKKRLTLPPKSSPGAAPVLLFFWKKVLHSLRNEKIGKVTKFRDPNLTRAQVGVSANFAMVVVVVGGGG